MLYDYRKESRQPMLLTLENGKTIEGEFIDLRIDTNTLPKGKLWYHIRHSDDDGAEPASLKNGCVVVNFYGTFICDPIDDFPCGQELEIADWSYPE
ncbi:LPD28 domain-containing protein [Phocaeicola vulgatus]|uniref:LPD28 domain-containing protein n=1 Tax=Phocaeicola vulgatus TaxID=821 RepID=UPI003569647B